MTTPIASLAAFVEHAGIRRDDGARYQPRLHDLRHTAAVHRLIAWYRAGADVQRLLPHLATYLGHVDLASTQRYLTMTPELLQEASRRFEQYARPEVAMTDRTMLGPWIRRFLLEHLVADRNLARNTQPSYRDTLISVLPFLSAAATISIDRLAIEDLSPSRLRRFLGHLETERGCRVGDAEPTPGARFIRSRIYRPAQPGAPRLVCCHPAIPFKKTATPVMAYLDKPEMDALLTVHSGRTAQGARNHALLLFLYNTGARVDEAVHVTVADLTLGASPSVRLLGKGRKARSCPLWPVTAERLSRLVRGHAPQDPVFQNRQGRPLTRFGIYRVVRHTVTPGPHQHPVTGHEARQSPHAATHLRGTSPARRGGHQHDPSVARPCVPRHYPRLCGSRPRPESEGAGALRSPGGGHREALAHGPEPHVLPQSPVMRDL